MRARLEVRPLAPASFDPYAPDKPAAEPPVHVVRFSFVADDASEARTLRLLYDLAHRHWHRGKTTLHCSVEEQTAETALMADFALSNERTIKRCAYVDCEAYSAELGRCMLHPAVAPVELVERSAGPVAREMVIEIGSSAPIDDEACLLSCCEDKEIGGGDGQ